MKILQVSAEYHPLLKTGGLADVTGALPQALRAHGCDVRVLLPGFPAVLAGLQQPAELLRFNAPWGAELRLLHGTLPGTPAVQAYVPGYRLKQEVQFERFGDNNRLKIPGMGEFTGIKSMIMLEVEGAGDYLPSYSGNLDIMTAAAKATGELLASRRLGQ